MNESEKKTQSNTRLCSIGECGGKHLAKGMCNKHYQRRWARKHYSHRVCLLPECNKNSWAKYCPAHEYRLKRYGDPKHHVPSEEEREATRKTTCRHCHKPYPPHELMKDILQNGKRYHRCRACNTALAKRYRATESGRKSVQKAVKKYERNNPERRKAWAAVSGIPPRPCQVCGTEENIHKHHPDPFQKRLIVFLCAKHHKQVHTSSLKLSSQLDAKLI
jgi:hypothetical protein